MRKIFKPFIALALIAVLVLSSCYGHSHNYRLVEEVKPSCEQDGVIAHYECDCGKYFDLDHNEITNIAISKLGHDLKHVEAKAATCTEAGNLEYWHCERCGKNYTSQDATTQITTIVVPALGHEYELKTVWNDDGTCLYELECEHDHSHKVIEGLNGAITHTDDTATCTSAGSVTYTLTLTYDVKTYTDTHTVQTGALEHDWKWVIDKEATATEDGVKHEECSRCGETRNEGTVIPHAHTHELQMVQGQSATETEAGFKAYYSCSCGKFFEDAETQVEIADLAAWKAEGGRGYVAPTGAAPHQHSLTLVAKVDATETTAGHEAYYVCSSCGKAYTSQDDESTLIEDLTAWLAEGGAGYIAPVPHQHDLALVLMLPATETTAGYKAYYTCSCGKYFEDAQGEVEIPDLAAWKADGGRGYIAPTGVAPHQHELTLVQGKEATTTEAGYKAYYACSCGKYFEDEDATVEIADLAAWKAEGGRGYLPVVIPPHTHEYTLVPAKAASCSEDGNIEYYICNVDNCGKLFVKNGDEYTEVTAADVVIAATGHSYGEWSVSTLPSANATGLATRECATCHHVDELTLPVVNEENYNAVIKTPATCGAKGVHTYTLKEDTKISFDLEDIEISGQHGELQSKEVSTLYTFTTKTWGDSTSSWTNGKEGYAFETGRGVQITSSATGANATTKEIFNNVTKVIVTYSTKAKDGAGNIVVRVSGDPGAIVSAVSKTGGTTDRPIEFKTDGNSGTVNILVQCTTNSIYIKSITIVCSEEVRSLTKHEGSEPSCEIDGEKTYYECPICHKFFEDAEGTKEITEDINTWKVISKLGHDFAAPTYSWNGGYCTATRVCKNDENHFETETVLGSEVKDTVETCTTNATGHLVATFENPAFESQSTEADSYVFENSALGHNYNDTPSRYSYSEDKWFAEYDCTRCDHVKREETDAVVVAIKYVGFATLQAAIDSSEDGDIRRVKDSEINESIKLTRDVKFVSLYYNGDFDFNGHTLLLEGEVDKLTLKVSASVSDQEINDSITVVGKKIVIDRAGEIATVTFELDGQAVTIHKDGTHTAYQTLEEAIAAFDGTLDEVIKLNAPLTANGSITITNTAVLDFETHDVTATSLVINDGVVFTVFNGKFLGSIDENDLMTGKLVIKSGYHAHVIEGGFDIHLLTVVHHDAVAATCTKTGTVEYWECDICKDIFSNAECTVDLDSIVAPAKGHSYGEPTYVWADDNSTCTATAVCTKCTDEEGHTVSKTVNTTSSVTQAQSCLNPEITTYSADFEDELFGTKIKEVETKEAAGHNWTYVSISWDSEDAYTAHVSLACSVDGCDETDSVEAIVTSEVTTEPTWNTTGVETYTATYGTGENKHTITKEKVLPVCELVKASTVSAQTTEIIYVIGKVTKKDKGTIYLGAFQLYSFTSDALYSSVHVDDVVVASGKVYDFTSSNKHTYEFKTGSTYHGKIEAVFSHEDEQDSTCEVAGYNEYYSYDSKYYTISDELEITLIGNNASLISWKAEGGDGYRAPLGHSWEFVEFSWTGFTAKAVYMCDRDGCSETKEETATVTSEITTPATCYSTGVRTYTASYDNQTDTKEEVIAKVAHSYSNDVVEYILVEGVWKSKHECTNEGCTDSAEGHYEFRNTNDVVASVTANEVTKGYATLQAALDTEADTVSGVKAVTENVVLKSDVILNNVNITGSITLGEFTLGFTGTNTFDNLTIIVDAIVELENIDVILPHGKELERDSVDATIVRVVSSGVLLIKHNEGTPTAYRLDSTHTTESAVLVYAISQLDDSADTGILLLGDITSDSTISINNGEESVTIDLGGYTLTSDINVVTGMLDIKSGKLVGNVSVADDAMLFTSSIELTGNITNNESNKAYVSIGTGVYTFDVTGNTVTLAAGLHAHFEDEKYNVHAIVEIVDAAVAPTCTKTGLNAGSHCDVCGDVLVVQTVVPATGHIYGDWSIETEPTTDVAGEARRVCSACSDIDTIVLPIITLATDDNYTVVVTTPATCTNKGVRTYTLKANTNISFTKEIAIDSNAHVFDNSNTHHVAAVAPTCTTAGNVEYWICTECLEKFTRSGEGTELSPYVYTKIADGEEVVAALGHNMKHHDAVAATCQAAGNIEYWYCDRCDKYFTDENGTTEVTQAETVVAKTPHGTESNVLSHKTGTVESDKTSTNLSTGKTLGLDSNVFTVIGDKLSGNNKPGLYSELRLYANSYIDIKIINGVNAQIKSIYIVRSENRVTSLTISVGENVIPLNSENAYEINATSVRILSESATVKVDQIVINYDQNSLEYVLTHHDAVAATCTNTGNVEYWECPTCHELFSDANGTSKITQEAIVTAIDSNAHVFEDNSTYHKAAVAPTCTTAGNIEYWVCKDCGEKFTRSGEGTELSPYVYTKISDGEEVVAALGHNMEHHDAVAATCTTAGNIEYWYCDRCDKYFTDANGDTEVTQANTVVSIVPTAHDYHEFSQTWNTDHTELTATFKCSRCNDEKTVTVTTTLDAEKGQIVIEDNTHTATVMFGGHQYQYFYIAPSTNQVELTKVFNNATVKFYFGADEEPTEVANLLEKTAYVRIVVTPNSGYRLDSIAATGVELSPVVDKDNEKTFTVGEDAITITVTTVRQFTVNFVTNGGSSVESQTVDTGSVLSSVTTTKDYYDFKGWFKESTFENEWIFVDDELTTEVDERTHVTGDQTLYAKWTPKTYTITYMDGGNTPLEYSGSNEDDLPTYHAYGTATTLVDGAKSGFTFQGWFEEQDCSGTAITELGATTVTGNKTLYAKWEEEHSATTYVYTEVTNVNQLTDGATIVITDSAGTKTFGEQKTNNFGQVNFSSSSSTELIEGAQYFTLVKSGNYWGIKASDNKYLYAASSSGNHLKSEVEISGNSKWNITITNSTTNVVATGSNTRKTMQYNSSSGLFACYASASQGAVKIYIVTTE